MFSTFFYNPIYNLLALILDFVTTDAGIAIILATITVKLVLFPLAKRAIKTQIGMKKIKPELDALQKKYGKKPKPEERQQMATEMMALYRENNVRPFASIFVILIQFPVLIALYLVFYKGGLPTIDPSLLYSFVPTPESVNMVFLGFIDLTGQKNIILALIAGAVQAVHSHVAIDVPEAQKDGGVGSDFARSFAQQMKFGLPLLIAGTAYFFGAAIALYLITSTSFMLLQEWLVRKDKAELKATK